MKTAWIAITLAAALCAGCQGKKQPATTEEPTGPEVRPDTGPTTAAPASTDGGEFGEVTTASGLKYVDLKVGDGPVPERGQMLSVHYTGWLENGTKFDSSVDRGEPLDFTIGVGQVIKGWDEGVGSMHVGGKRKLIVPSELGYGAKGVGPIPPDATLIFEVELLAIKSPQQDGGAKM